MRKYRSSFLQTLQWRGFIHQCTHEQALDDALCDDTLTAYIGFDCTADSLHVGSLLPIMLLRHLQQAGHIPVVLLGSGTTRIGDPSGKDSARQMLDDATIAANKAGILKVFARYLDMGKAIVVDNADWLTRLHYLDVLRDVGPHFTINRMLGFDSVRLRLEREQPLSFLEFNYMVLQAYDFVELARRHNCRLQMGGSDQWGNIVNGVELGRRMHGQELFGLTSPLLTTASGQKMGKTAAGAIWLDSSKCSPYDFWQFWRNTDDADVERFLKLFTDLPAATIADLAARQGAAINEAKKVLADAVTTLCHGAEAARRAAATAEETFAAGAAGSDLPAANYTAVQWQHGIAYTDAALASGLVASKGEARRHIKAGALRINGEPVMDENGVLQQQALQKGAVKLSVGKKKHALIRCID